MSEEILINVTPTESRVALVENGTLQEAWLDRARHGYLGNIYKGTVCRVLPGMQAAFVDIGLERTAFLHASDVRHVDEERMTGQLPAAAPDGPPPGAPGGSRDASTGRSRGNPVSASTGAGSGGSSTESPGRSSIESPIESPIGELLREGSEIVVQVVKDPLGTKGARLTTHLSVPSRFLVLLPGSSHIGVSARIEDEQERSRLQSIVERLREGRPAAGYIVRTNAEGVEEFALAADMEFLDKVWARIIELQGRTPAGECIYEDLSLPVRALRDLMHPGVEKVRIDHQETFEKVREFVRSFVPDWLARVEHYAAERPIFDLYGVDDEIERALHRTTPLKSGGHLVIDQTEAMTTIDVNTGAYVGHRTLEETIYKTNLEAAQAIARQLRLRNLGGIIIVDFIDMHEEQHRVQVLRTLEEALARDHVRCSVSGLSELGLVEMTRKRTRESLGHVLCEPCPVCGGRGSVKTAETVCLEIFREIMRSGRQFEASRLLVLAPPAVVDLVLDEHSTTIAELEELIGKTVRFQREELYTPEQYDVVLL